MIPMLRTLARSVSTSCATGVFPCLELAGSRLTRAGRRSAGLLGAAPPGGMSPAVVGEGLVRLGHLVRVLAALDARAQAVARVEQLVHQALDHGLPAALPGEGDQPAQRERGRAARLHLDRHLVGGATDAAG